MAAYASVVWKSAWAVNYNRKTSPVGTRSTIPNSHVPYGCGGGALVTKVVRSKATSAGTAPRGQGPVTVVWGRAALGAGMASLGHGCLGARQGTGARAHDCSCHTKGGDRGKPKSLRANGGAIALCLAFAFCTAQ